MQSLRQAIALYMLKTHSHTVAGKDPDCWDLLSISWFCLSRPRAKCSCSLPCLSFQWALQEKKQGGNSYGEQWLERKAMSWMITYHLTSLTTSERHRDIVETQHVGLQNQQAVNVFYTSPMPAVSFPLCLAAHTQCLLYSNQSAADIRYSCCLGVLISAQPIF